MSLKNDASNNECKSTPPTKNKKVRNPFDKNLIEMLHKPICSPGMCKTYKKKNNGTFKWDIDQACSLVPADIVACNSQFEPSPDPMLERIAEEATDRFFSQNMVIPSPLETSKKVKPLLQELLDPTVQVNNFKDKSVMKIDVSAQTVLTFPPNLPAEVEKILQKYCTYTQDQNISGDYEITANGSLRRQLLFEEHSDMELYDSEQTDDEVHLEPHPPSSYETHSPVVISPDLTQESVTKGLKRTFGTPLNKGCLETSKACYRNKVLDVVDFGEPCLSPIEFRTPKRIDQESAASSSLASASISPVNKPSSEEKNNFTSPESEAMATCLDCIISESESKKKGPCFCNITPNKLSLKRSASLKESPTKPRRCSNLIAEKRSLSMSSLNRSRSVQKLDFSMDMSIDGSVHNSSQDDTEISISQGAQPAWSLVEESGIQHLVKLETYQKTCSEEVPSVIDNTNLNNILDNTPTKGKCKQGVLSHEISKIRSFVAISPANMSLDSSLDSTENPLSLEDKKMDFNNVDLKYLSKNLSQFTHTQNPKVIGDSSCSFKRFDSGFNENTFYVNASSYYESAIKPSELTVTNISKNNSNHSALKEISNVHWMRVDSGFKDETSADNTQFYQSDELSVAKFSGFRFSEAKLNDKENVVDDFMQISNKKEALSMSDIFTEEMKFNCNFSSTPSKNKSRKLNS
ncbi:uncharacterized protein bora [Battus philenor]|uniref:uncharacterized protein bora n=1 Tax=Battus philenor TaxID=42288 RepID=UPI0035D0328F